MNWEIHTADILDWAASYNGPKFHALLCDPPYELKFMGKRWDATGISFQLDTWAALAQHLHPGAFGMAFASSRGWHRLAVAIEDAGMIIQPSIFGWATGCLSEDTEILTEDGWKSYQGNLTGLRVMCYNVSTNELEFMPAQEVYEYDYQDTAYRIESDSTDQIVTRNHRCLVERDGSLVFQRANALESEEIVPILESVQDLQGDLLCQGLKGVAQRQGMLLKNMWAESNRPEQTSQGSKTQTQGGSNNLPYLRDREIHARCLVAENQGDTNMLQSLSGQTYVTRPGTRGAIESNGLLGTQGVDKGGACAILREDKWSQQLELERRSNLFSQEGELWALQYQVCEMPTGVYGDGSQGWLCDGASSDRGSTPREAFEAVRGGTPQRPQSRKQQPRKFDAIQQQQCTQKIREVWKARATLATVTPVFYSGKVWCVRVPTGAFVARRNGHVFITGNSSFPKATRIDTQIDKRAGVERTETRQNRWNCVKGNKGRDSQFVKDGYVSHGGVAFDETLPATPLARAWAGHRYGGQVLKNALEPIIVFQKPWEGKRLDCIVETGAGAMWVEGGRVSHNGLVERHNTPSKSGLGKHGIYGDSSREQGANSPTRYHSTGRWPSNFTLTHVSLPVMRICGKIPSETESQIRRHYDGYTKVSELRQGVRDRGLARAARAEVLQRGMRERSQEGKDAARIQARESDTDLPTVRQGVQGLEGMAQAGTPEVLQLGLQDRIPEDHDGRKEYSSGSTTYRGNQSQDECRAEANRREPSRLEGGQVEGHSRLQDDSRESLETRDQGVSCADDAEVELHCRASSDNGDGTGEAIGTPRASTSPEWGQSRQPAGESAIVPNRRTFSQASASGSGIEPSQEGKRAIASGSCPLEVLACDVPERWLKYFECTGEDLGCRRVGTRRVRGHKGYPNGPGGTDDGYTWASHEVSSTMHKRKGEWKHPSTDPDGYETVTAWDCVPECPVRRLGEMSGERRSGGKNLKHNGEKIGYNGGWGPQDLKDFHPGDTGTAARFYYQADWSYEIAERLAMADPVMYCPKASRKERDAGLEEWVAREVPYSEYRENYKDTKDFVTHYPDGSPRPVNKVRNPHPTVKPIALTRWLATLLLPPPEYAPRRLLIPFSGSGSEGIGAGLAGWEEMVLIDLLAENNEIAEARLGHWLNGHQLELL